MSYDLLLKGGILIDPAEEIHAVMDVGFANGKVAAVGNDLPSSEALEVIDCSEHYVAPGMIDLHVHVFWGVSHYGIEPDRYCIDRGVTTAVDAGSAGAGTFPGFRKYVIDTSVTRLFGQLNISSQGMLTAEIGELNDIQYASIPKAVAMVKNHRDLVLGIKVRLTKYQVVSEAAGIRPLYLAREAADEVGLPMMVHPQECWCETIDDILGVMREGDILTHCFHGKGIGILDDNCNIRKSVREAMDRGVIFDVGHGRSSFKWGVAEHALRQNFQPQTISTDLHVYNINGPVHDLITTINKFLYLGLSLDDVLRKATASPARVLRMSDQIGTLKVGAWGDAVVFKLKEGKLELVDCYGEKRVAGQLIVLTTVVKAGKVYLAEKK